MIQSRKHLPKDWFRAGIAFPQMKILQNTDKNNKNDNIFQFVYIDLSYSSA